MKEWKLVCLKCGTKQAVWCWSYELDDQTCPKCNVPLEFYSDNYSNAPGIVTDDIPGGIEIRHGLVDPQTGEPRRFYSKSDIKRAANEYGLKIMGDTPGQNYRVSWDGIRKRRKDEIYDKDFPKQ